MNSSISEAVMMELCKVDVSDSSAFHLGKNYFHNVEWQLTY